MTNPDTHRPLCMIELIAEGHATRCPGDQCTYWEHGCVLARIEGELDGRPEVAALLLEVRRELERAQRSDDGAAVEEFHRWAAAGPG